MSLADVQIILIFLSIAGVTALVASVYGLSGTCFMLTIHRLMNGFFLLAFLIDAGKL